MPKLEEAIRLSGFDITYVFHGANEDSPDRLGRIWAERNGIPVRAFEMEDRRTLTQWGIPLAAAGPRRNERMKKGGAQGVIALWDGASTGTSDMMRRMKKKPGFCYRLDGAPHEHWPKQLAMF